MSLTPYNQKDVEEDLDEPNYQAALEELQEAQEEQPETVEDRQFIDDEGVVHEEAPWADEEEEEEEIEPQDMEKTMQAYEQAKKGGGAIDEEQARSIAKEFIMACERAVKDDMELYKQRKPAVEKLKLVKRMEEYVKNKTIANRLLQDGFLGTLKAWLEMMPDGTLPNIKVRSTVLGVLEKLPINTADEIRLDQLKRSQIGRVVMFLSQLKDESQENRTLAEQLVIKWSRPLVARDHNEREDDQQVYHKEEMLKLRQDRETMESRKRKAELDQEAAKKLRPGETGFRYHARLPTAARMDYVKKPESRVLPQGGGGGGPVGKQFQSLLRKMQGKGKGKAGGGGGSKVSISGKDMD